MSALNRWVEKIEPFFRKFTGTWYVQIGKQQINLGKDQAAAFQKYHEIMSSRGRAKATFDSVPHLFDAYLDWLEANRAKATYDKARHYLSLFAQRIGPGFAIAKLEGLHVTQWIESRKDWTASEGMFPHELIKKEVRRNLTLKVLEENEARFNRLFHKLQLAGDARKKQHLADEALTLLFAKYKKVAA